MISFNPYIGSAKLVLFSPFMNEDLNTQEE